MIAAMETIAPEVKRCNNITNIYISYFYQKNLSNLNGEPYTMKLFFEDDIVKYQ